jgi:hypothetical protein
LPTCDIIGGKNLLVAHDGVHHGGNSLASGVWMSKTQRVAEFMEKDAANIRDGWSVGHELERATIRIERDRPIKENIRFDHVRTRTGVVGHGQRTGAEGLSVNRIGEDDRIQTIARGGGGQRIHHIRYPDALDLLVPHVSHGHDGVVPGAGAILKSAPGTAEAKLHNHYGTRRPAFALESVGARYRDKASRKYRENEQKAAERPQERM